MQATFYGMTINAAYKLESFLKKVGASHRKEWEEHNIVCDIIITTKGENIGIGCSFGADMVTLTAFVNKEIITHTIDTADFERMVVI